MHTLVPHDHKGDYYAQNSQSVFSEAASVVDYIRIAFLIDLGEGHLDTFEQGANFDFNTEFQIESCSKPTPISNLIPESIISQSLNVDNNQYSNNVPIVRQYFLSHIDFRGPPSNA